MNVEIRPLREEDALTSVKWRNIPEIWVHTTFLATKEISLEDEQKWIKKVLADETSERFAIMADGVYVGNIYLTDIRDGVGEYGIFIGEKEYWGKGVAREASKHLIDFAKDSIKLSRIVLSVREDNSAAYRLYQKLGFQKTGTKDGFVVMTLDLTVK